MVLFGQTFNGELSIVSFVLKKGKNLKFVQRRKVVSKILLSHLALEVQVKVSLFTVLRSFQITYRAFPILQFFP